MALRPQQAEAIFGHGVNPRPLLWRSQLDMAFLNLKRTNHVWSFCSSNHPRSRTALLLLLLMAGDVESNPGPGPEGGQYIYLKNHYNAKSKINNRTLERGIYYSDRKALVSHKWSIN